MPTVDFGGVCTDMSLQYPKSAIFSRGAGEPSNNVFSCTHAKVNPSDVLRWVVSYVDFDRFSIYQRTA